MSHAPSRLLQRLDAAIAASRNVVEADCLRAEQALHHVRQGHFETANALVVDVRQRHEQRPLAVTSVWLSLVDGLAAYFTDISSPVARDKLRRAYAMSEAAGLVNLHALCAAWMAQLDYADANMPAMATHLAQSLKSASRQNISARGRASLVLIKAYHISMRSDIAKKWYSIVHRCAIDEGDDATLSALMFNMASVRTANLTQLRFITESEAPEEIDVLLCFDSLGNFDRVKGATSLSSTVPLVRAQIFSLREQPRE